MFGFPERLINRTIGFDSLFRHLERSLAEINEGTYPPYDIIRVGEDDFRVEIAVAGFSPDEMKVVAEKNTLTVTGTPGKEDGVERVYRGIARRAFTRRFALAEHVDVVGADYENGLLRIHLKRIVPEAHKPRNIQIQGVGSTPALTSECVAK
jgi:molecular chaperone IbpA